LASGYAVGVGSVVVVGAGIFGVTGALALRRRGWQVTLLDPGPVPHPDAASTDISKVVRLDYGADGFYLELMERALVGWRRYNQRLPQPLFHETGFSILSSVPLQPGSFELESLHLLERRGHPVERLAAAELRHRLPAWSEKYIDGYFNPQGGWAQSGAVVAALLAEAQDAGVELRAERVERLDQITAERVVVAAGAWTATLVPALSTMLRPIGQPVFHFAPADSAPYQAPSFVPWAADISRTGWYGFCANADGVVKIANHGPGRAVDPTGPRAVADDAEAKFRAFMAEALPSLAAAPRVASRLCLYCDSADGDLLIDRDPAAPHVVVAAGGSGHGFKFAPLLGDWIADAVEGADPIPRFGWRTAAASRVEDARYSGG